MRRALLISVLIFLPQVAFATPTVIFLTSGTTWTVPSDWNNANNTIEVIGAGGAGGIAGGGGGAYSKVANLSLNAGDSIRYQVGSGGGSDGGDTFFDGTICNNSPVCAKGGQSGGGPPGNGAGGGGAGGLASAGKGDVKYSGGRGGDALWATEDDLAGSGGGAAGPNGNGNAGGSAYATSYHKGNVDWGTSNGGGSGDAGFGGAGGDSGDGFSGGGAGGNGVEWDASHGSGGGGGGSYNVYSCTTSPVAPPAGSGGLYGGGGGGSTQNGFGVNCYSDPGLGATGLIVITYTPVCTVVYGDHSATITNPGTCTFTVPDSYGTLTVQAWGGGGGGGAADGYYQCDLSGGNGGDTVFGSILAGGGGGGRNWGLGGYLGLGVDSCAAAVGGSASGGDVNLPGGDGTVTTNALFYGTAPIGGSSPNGGSGGWLDVCFQNSYFPYTCGWYFTGGGPPTVPGGGGGGNMGFFGDFFPTGGGGGGGGYVSKTYSPDSLPTGSIQTITVGTGGAGGYKSGYMCGWLCAGNYQIWADAGAPGQVTIAWTDPVNTAPTAPVITGPASGYTKTDYTYTFTSTDPDSDTIRYAVDWDDNGTIDEYVPALGYVSSGTTGSTAHSWNSSNTQTFKALAQDSLGNTSGWASYTVNMSPNAPVVFLTATPSSIDQGQSSALTWSSSHANSCTGTNFSTGGATQNTSPGVSVSPIVTTTYTATCTGQGNQEASDSATVTVAVCTPVYSCTNSTTRHSTCPLPSGTDTPCASGQVCSTNACEDTYSCLNTHTILNDHTGATTNCPAPLICSPGSPTCVTAPAIQVLGALEAVPALVLEGDATLLFWNIENADESTCSVTGSDGSTVSEGLASSGPDGVETGSIDSQTVFTLTCTGADGQPFTSSVTVNVVPLWLEF